MKKIIVMVCIAVFTYSCDPAGSVKFFINNTTEYNGTLTYYRDGDRDTTFSFDADTITLFYDDAGLGITSPGFLSVVDDSAVIRLENHAVAKYYVDSIANGKKNIYNEASWHIKKLSKRSNECTFTVNEEDVTVDEE